MTAADATRSRHVPVAKPHFDREEERLILDVLRSGWVTQGPRVAELEGRFAAAVEAEEAVAVSSGTAALFLAMTALDVGRGDEVVTPSLSFIATANSIVHCGATPVFVDVDPRTYNLDPEAVEAAIGPRTRAVMVVHQLGLPADLDALQRIADRHGIHLIEDSACAAGARYRGHPIGSSNNLGCFSFHPRKVLVTGEGGMITTPDRQLAARLRRLRHQGMSMSDLERHAQDRVVVEEYPEIGYNFRLSDLHAAVGLAQMDKLAAMVTRRREIGRRYDQALADLEGVEVRLTPAEAEPNYQSYVFRLRGADREQRLEVMEALEGRGVASRRGLMAAHLEPCYRGARVSGSLQHTEAAEAQTLLLPIYDQLSDDDQSYVIDRLRDALSETVGRGSGRR